MAEWKGLATCMCYAWTGSKCEGEDCNDSQRPNTAAPHMIDALCSVCKGKAQRRGGSLGLRVLDRERLFIFERGYPNELAELGGRGAGSTKRKAMDKPGWKWSNTLGTNVLALYVYIDNVSIDAKKAIRAIICEQVDALGGNAQAILKMHATTVTDKYPDQEMSLHHFPGADHKTKLFIHPHSSTRGGTETPVTYAQQYLPQVLPSKRQHVCQHKSPQAKRSHVTGDSSKSSQERRRSPRLNSSPDGGCPSALPATMQ